MKLGIIGLPGSGKSTVFRALTGVTAQTNGKGQDPGLGVVMVEDQRLTYLAEYYHPKKVTPVHVEYLDIAGLTGDGKPGREIGDRVLANIRPMDALVHCVRCFDSPVTGPADPVGDWESVEAEMILSDLAVVEKRIERLKKEMKKGRKDLAAELSLLEEAKQVLEDEKPLRTFQPALESDSLKGFSFLSAKPQLVLANADDSRKRNVIQEDLDAIRESVSDTVHLATDWLYADAEAEIARLDPEDAREFLEDMDLEEDAKNRIVRTSFDLLGQMVFFTAGDPEARAWPLRNGDTALKAAGTIHSDIERGFIRAEVVAFDDFKAAGSMQAAQKAAKVRLEGKDYRVKDGDIILFRFNV